LPESSPTFAEGPIAKRCDTATVGQINPFFDHCVSHLLPMKAIWQKLIFIFFSFGYRRWPLSSVAVIPPAL
jgi:hypothetical protein